MKINFFPMSFPAQGMRALFTMTDALGSIVGAVTAREQNPLVMEFAQLYVMTDCRRNGIGRKLVKQVEDYARHNGYKAISCGVAARNLDARKFYEALGFTPAYQYGDGDILYTKPISKEEARHG